ncbi:MAG: oligoendopeptidase F [Saccharofermentanales bacterium]
MPQKEKLDNNKIDEQYIWRLSDIFESTDSWDAALQKLGEPLNELLTYKDKIGESAKSLAGALNLDKECSIQMMELYAYAKMHKDLDNGNDAYQAMYDRIVGEYFNMTAQTSFLAPAISGIDENTLRSWISEEPALAEYAHYLDNIIRNKKHILSEKEETILSNIGPMADGIEEAFSMLNDLELDLGEIEIENGEKVKLTHGKFGIYREHKNRSIRAQAYENMHKSYKRFGNTIAALYTSSAKGDVFFMKTRGYSSCLEKALFSDNLPEKIYTQLIESIHERMPSFYKYLAIRKKQLNLEEMHLFDCSVPIIDMPDKEFKFEEAKDILRKGLSPLGKQYLDDIEKLFSNRAIDVYETKGKRSGAYAWGTYLSHPYMLLNWSDRLNDVFTFAHETGHCMHSFYSNRNQSYVNSHYPIFLAEIASTVNENILLQHMIDSSDTTTLEGKKEKAYLVNYFLEGVKNTVFRQTMFAEFEMIIHAKIENGEPVTSQSLCDIYGSLLKLYFGDDVEIDEYMNWEWARIPHFYSAFYVYKYATGFCAATKISNEIFAKGEPAVAKYLEFLSAGGKDYPANTLLELGIDMTAPDAVMDTIDEFDSKVAILEELLQDIYESGC